MCGANAEGVESNENTMAWRALAYVCATRIRSSSCERKTAARDAVTMKNA
jgi:hypothetical protein